MLQVFEYEESIALRTFTNDVLVKQGHILDYFAYIKGHEKKIYAAINLEGSGDRLRKSEKIVWKPETKKKVKFESDTGTPLQTIMKYLDHELKVYQ